MSLQNVWKKRVWIGLLIITFILLIFCAGCGENSDTKSQQTPEPTIKTTEPTKPPTSQPTKEPSRTAKITKVYADYNKDLGGFAIYADVQNTGDAVINGDVSLSWEGLSGQNPNKGSGPLTTDIILIPGKTIKYGPAVIVSDSGLFDITVFVIAKDGLMVALDRQQTKLTKNTN